MEKYKKYKLTEEKKRLIGIGKTLYRIEALIDFSDVKKGDKGGWVESEKNLSQDGDAWVSNDVHVFDDARVYGNARIFGAIRVFGHSEISGDVRVFGCSSVCNINICGASHVIAT